MRNLFFGLFLFLLSGTGVAQTQSPLEPHGKLPRYFYYPSHDVVNAEIVRRNASGDMVNQQEQDFMREMGYFSQQRMFTGLVLFNDSLSDYITKVAAVVLK